MATPDFIYLTTLSVIQPARIQDVEIYASKLHGESAKLMVLGGQIRTFHDSARRAELVISVRKGLYTLSKIGAHIIRKEPFSYTLDNRRIFLIKAQRRGIM